MLRLLIPAGKATPAAPVGPALGQKGLNIMDFCKQVRTLYFILYFKLNLPIIQIIQNTN